MEAGGDAAGAGKDGVIGGEEGGDAGYRFAGIGCGVVFQALRQIIGAKIAGVTGFVGSPGEVGWGAGGAFDAFGEEHGGEEAVLREVLVLEGFEDGLADIGRGGIYADSEHVGDGADDGFAVGADAIGDFDSDADVGLAGDGGNGFCECREARMIIGDFGFEGEGFDAPGGVEIRQARELAFPVEALGIQESVAQPLLLFSGKSFVGTPFRMG